MVRRLPEVKDQIMSNFLYKFVSFFAAFVLWLTVMGKKDVVMVREMSVEFITKPAYAVKYMGERRVSLRLAGSRMSIKKLTQDNRPVLINLKENGEGVYSIRIPEDSNLDLPLGVHVLSADPSVISVNVVKEESNNGNRRVEDGKTESR